MRLVVPILLMLAAGMRLTFAVLANVSGTMTYQQSPPTDADIAGWTTSWPANGITGWDYVGRIGGTSGVYLGDGWVLTAAHVGIGPFILSGVTYPPVAKSQKTISGFDGTADLLMFRISPAPALPLLSIRSESPVLEDPVVMIGYGGGHGKTWGLNTVAGIDIRVRSGQTARTIDFFASSTAGNKTRLVTGDSGGGGFIYNASMGRWELAGIHHAIDRAQDSCMVQLSRYIWQINFIRYGLLRKLAPGISIAVILLLVVGLVWRIVRRDDQG